MVFLVLILIPVIIAILTFVFGKHKVTWFEFLGQLAIQAGIAGISVAIVYHSNTSDVEIWNGRVTAKKSEKVTCSHEYCCGTCTRTVCSGSGKTRSCHTESYCCRYCKHHAYDVDWNYWTSDDGKNSISRIDWQGLKEPPRWSAIVVGEPSSSKHSYTNYVKAAPDTLFKSQGLAEQYQAQLPQYPDNVYDLYRLNRVVPQGIQVPNLKEWNNKLSELNAQIGQAKEVNMIVFLLKNKSHEFFDAMEQQYLGGKKNDAILVVSVDDTNTIQWADVMAWTDNKAFHIFTRDAIKELGILDLSNTQMLDLFAANVQQHYQRKSMEDFKYLEESITPSVAQWVITMILGILAAIGMSFFVYHNDIIEIKNKRRF